MSNMKKNKLAVISSFAEDVILYKNLPKEIKTGGPAFWIAKTLKILKSKADIFTGKKPAVVEITIDKTGEHGKIKSASTIKTPIKTSADFLLISTVADEFDLEKLNKLNKKVILDVQGYTRVSRTKNKLFNLPIQTAEKITVMKCTEAESKLMEKELVQQQKKRILLITRGGKNVIIFSRGKKYELPVLPIKPTDTIGAGDTFLTAFTVKLIKDEDVIEATKFAVKFTGDFLKSKT